MTTIKTTANIKKITSGKGVEIVLSLPSSVSLDELSELKQRDEFYIALGVSQTEVRDFLEPHRGYQARIDGSGVVQSVKSSDEETEDEGEQLEIEDVKTEAQSEQFDEINEEDAEQSESESEETEEEENDGEPSEDELEIESMESEVSQEEREQEDDDKPLTFIDAEKSEVDNW